MVGGGVSLGRMMLGEPLGRPSRGTPRLGLDAHGVFGEHLKRDQSALMLSGRRNTGFMASYRKRKSSRRAGEWMSLPFLLLGGISPFGIGRHLG